METIWNEVYARVFAHEVTQKDRHTPTDMTVREFYKRCSDVATDAADEAVELAFVARSADEFRTRLELRPQRGGDDGNG